MFAVPGNINSKTSQGTNTIIKQGAKLGDVSSGYFGGIKIPVTPQKTVSDEQICRDLNENQRKIFEVLGHEPLQIDKIVKQSGLTVSHALEVLLDLELNGHVRQLSGKMFVKEV